MKRKIIMAALTAAMLVNGITVYAEEASETGFESLPAIEVESETEILEEQESILETEEVIEETAETTENLEAYKQTGVEGFVYRLYKLVLNREPEQKGYTEWVNWLKTDKQRVSRPEKGLS